MFCLVSRTRSIRTSQLSQTGRASLARDIAAILLIANSALVGTSSAQTEFPTSRRDNARTNADTSETLLTPANVNKNSFGRLFSTPVDYVVMAQPLFMPDVNIPGKGTHNVVYVVTQADSVYAIDADKGTQLWYASMLNGGSTASGTYLPCGTAPGFTQEGIVGTPVIDPNTDTMYLVAKTLLNTTVRHHLHAIDIATGLERSGSPVLIQAKSVSNKGKVTTFNSLHQKNRPGLLLVNGNIYMAFGSNYCNDHDSGWLLSYDASTLQQNAVFNTSPDYGLVSIWQAGNGPAADAEGNIYVETAESGSNGFDVPNGGQTYCNSVLKLAPDLTVADYFTPWSVAYLNSHDLDLSSTGSLLLPDLTDSPYVHEMVASGKQGMVYVLNRDNMGMYASNDSQIIQECALIPGDNNDVMFGSPAYWNNTVYFSPSASPVLAFPLAGGTLGTPTKTAQTYPGSHSPLISSNGNNNGILWNIPGQLYAFDATSLNLLYSTTQAPNGRDEVPPIGHFTTPMVANGKVYVATNSSLEVFGLFRVVAVRSGGNQSAMVGKALPAPLRCRRQTLTTGSPKPARQSISAMAGRVARSLPHRQSPTQAETFPPSTPFRSRQARIR